MTYYAECLIKANESTQPYVKRVYTINAPDADSARVKAADHSGGVVVEFSPWGDMTDEEVDLVI